MTAFAVEFNYNGVTVPVDLLGIGGKEWRDAKRWTGMSAGPLQRAALDDSDFEAIAALLAITLRRLDPAVEYEDVLETLSFAVFAVTAEEVDGGER